MYTWKTGCRIACIGEAWLDLYMLHTHGIRLVNSISNRSGLQSRFSQGLLQFGPRNLPIRYRQAKQHASNFTTRRFAASATFECLGYASHTRLDSKPNPRRTRLELVKEAVKQYLVSEVLDCRIDLERAKSSLGTKNSRLYRPGRDFCYNERSTKSQRGAGEP